MQQNFDKFSVQVALEHTHVHASNLKFINHRFINQRLVTRGRAHVLANVLGSSNPYETPSWYDQAIRRKLIEIDSRHFKIA